MNTLWLFILLVVRTGYSNVLEETSLSRNKCKENLSVPQRVQETLIIVKAKVIEVILDPVFQKYTRGNGMPSKTLIEVSDILKGETIVEPILKDSIFRMGERGSQPLLLIDGINNPELCRSNVEAQKTFIFFLNFGFSPNQLHIQFSLLDNTSQNMATIEAQLDGDKTSDNSKPPAAAHPNKITQQSAGVDLINSHLCGGKLSCHIYAYCEEDPSSTEPKCVCPEISACPSDSNSLYERLEKPVCGSDRQTYSSLCRLRAISCQQGIVIGKLHDGDCNPTKDASQIAVVPHMNEVPPRVNCGSLVCPPYAKCQNLPYRSGPFCDCYHQACSLHVDLVCGSDGFTYSNLCQLHQQACTRHQEVSVVHRGPCDSKQQSRGIQPVSCSGRLCPHYGECEKNLMSGIRSCTCDLTDCSSEFAPVCGSDDVTYSNECQLKKQSCLRDVLITVKYRGECGQNNKLQMHHTEAAKDLPNIECPLYGQVTVDSSGKMNCICPTCPTDKSPVCGSDGFTYFNLCELQRFSCLENRTIQIEQKTACDPCRKIHCSHGGECSIKEQSVADQNLLTPSDKRWFKMAKCSCQHIKCDSVQRRGRSGPICANDGQTYAGQCNVRLYECIQQRPIQTLYRGPCIGKNPCNSKNCQHPSEYCRINLDGSASCVCPEYCPKVLSPVCGSDGVTYESICHLSRLTCLRKQKVIVVHQGKCSEKKLCNGTCQKNEVCRQQTDQSLGMIRPQCICADCPEQGVGNQVCGSDENTYRSGCHLTRVACMNKNSRLKMQHEGPCDECKKRKCNNYAKCVRGRFGEAVCVCPTDCGHNGKLVCGSDGETYQNECFLKVKSCAANKLVTVERIGPCRDCQETCGYGRTCRDGRCVCIQECPTADSPTCGTNGQIYRNICELYKTACERNIDISPDVYGTMCSGGGAYMSDGAANGKNSQSDCNCNSAGTVPNTQCDKVTKQCVCRDNVQGLTCDSCSTGFRGFEQGCTACSCNLYGSKGPNCHPNSGQCYCKPGVSGQLCDRCPIGQVLEQNGCIDEKSKIVQNPGEMSSYGFQSASSIQLRIPKWQPKIKEFEARIKLSFSRGNGTIFYYGSFTRNSFLSVVLRDGYVEYRYNCGSGTKLLRSGKALMLNREYDITILRKNRLGRLTIEGLPEVSDKSCGRRKISAIQSKLFLGKLPADANTLRPDQLGNERDSFSGCLHYLSIRLDEMAQAHVYQLNKGETLLDRTTEIDTNGCSSWRQQMLNTEGVTNKFSCDITKSQQCRNGGRCALNQNKKGVCSCKIGYQGAFCEEKSRVIPEFNGENSYLKLSTEDLKLRKKLDFEFDLYIENENGLLALILKRHGGNSASFLSISLVDGHIQVDCRTGAGLYVLKSLKKVPLRQWFRLKVSKQRKRISFEMNGELQKIKIVPAGFKKMGREYKRKKTRFNVNQADLYVGGYPYNILNSDIAGLKTWFKGALQNIILNQNNLQLALGEGITTVDQWQGSPCFQLSNTCSRRKLVCEPLLNETKCSCPKFGSPNFSPTCIVSQRMVSDQSQTKPFLTDKLEESSLLRLNGKIYNKFQNRIFEKQFLSYEENILFEFKTDAPDGMQLLMRQANSIQEDFLILAVRDGHQELAVNLAGNGNIVRLTSEKLVNDGQWHTVEIIRSQSKVSLTVDNEVLNGFISGKDKALNTDGYIWLGGYEADIIGFPRAYQQKFVGCVKQMRVNNRNVILNKDNAMNWSSYPRCDT